jgi:hypothetical protein
METDIEIRRERVYVSSDMNINELMEKYGITSAAAVRAKRKGWFTKNYMRKQVIIDRDHFNPAISYSIAKQVFWKSFSKNPVAQSIKEDLIQEAVSLMFMQSGKVKEGANERYNENYGYWWCAYNAMLAYLKTRERQLHYDESLEAIANPKYPGKRVYSPDYGWCYC